MAPRPVPYAARVLVAGLMVAACERGSGEMAPAPSGVARTDPTTSAVPATTASSSAAPGSSPLPSSAPGAGAGAPVVAAAGDISCEPGQPATAELCRMQATAELVAAAGPAAVLTLGDNQYEDGALEKFRSSYEATWGRFKEITRPSAGNHDLAGGRGSGYFSYFGAAAGRPGQGWYSFDLGGWHLVALNSNCSLVGGCGPGSAQLRWLEADLAASTARCTIAYWHHPRFSSGYHGDDESVGPLWQALHDAGTEIVLAGHDHHYERFAPMSPDGAVDEAGGIRSFVVGTGGRSLYPVLRFSAASRVRQSFAYGVLLLTLGQDEYQWRFAAEPGADFSDTGRDTCH